ncbi:MAG: hypothetical protein C3F15_10045 [Holophagae bacterium]|nr:MAG: hypothetical protein C3F15_10045 [Holophagae bacterium]
MAKKLRTPAGRPGRRRESRWQRDGWWTTAAAFAAPFALYLRTLAPTIYNLDSAELTTAAATGGLVRATGYPLYLLIGRVWSLLPVGDVGYRMNLLSAVCGALTVALGERILRRLGVGVWARLAALGLLAVAQFFWALALIAEVYTLHTAILAGVILALLRWAEKPTPGRLALATFVMGIGFGNHVATVLAAPGCLWFVLATEPRKALAPRSLGLAAAGLVTGLAVYLYLPLAYWTRPEFNYVGWFSAGGQFEPVNLATLEGLWWLVSGKVFADVMMAYTTPELIREAGHFGAELVRAFMIIGIGPGLAGIVVAWRRSRALGGMLLLVFAISAGFYINYRVIDKDTMFLPAYLIWALWVGLGYQWLIEWAGQTSPAVSAGAARTTVLALKAIMAGAVVFAVSWNWPLVDLSDDWSTRVRGEKILELARPGALIVGWWGTVPVVEYLQLVEGQRPDIQAINRFLIRHDELVALLEREVDRRPVYIDEPVDGLSASVQPTQIGPLFRLYRAGGPPAAVAPRPQLPGPSLAATGSR